MDCSSHPLLPPKVVAIATDAHLTPTNTFTDAGLPGGVVTKYGQDITFGTGRVAPRKQDVGKTDAVLKPKMQKLTGIFAAGDTTGMTGRLFTQFLAKQSTVNYFDDADLNKAAAAHVNIQSFITAALNAPGPGAATGKVRIHEALRRAKWDIKMLSAPTDLGVPALNLGSKTFSTGDFNNGLGVMINGIQHVYVVATHYKHDAAAGKYCITLKYVFYDVFGLDDDDLNEFGAASDSNVSNAAIGITAWWQLQHQHGYAPLVTRIVLERTFEAPAV
jgi:hypothetical protein